VLNHAYTSYFNNTIPIILDHKNNYNTIFDKVKPGTKISFEGDKNVPTQITISGIKPFINPKNISRGSFSDIYRYTNGEYSLILKDIRQKLSSHVKITGIEPNEVMIQHSYINNNFGYNEMNTIRMLRLKNIYFSEAQAVCIDNKIILEGLDGSINDPQFENALIDLYIRNNKLYYKCIILIFRVICNTIINFFDNGLYYFDLKPNNILYKFYDTYFIVFLGDLGSLVTKTQLSHGFPITFVPINFVETQNKIIKYKPNYNNAEKIIVWGLGVLFLYYNILGKLGIKYAHTVLEIFVSGDNVKIYNFIKKYVSSSIYKFLHPNELLRADLKQVFKYLYSYSF